jgi:MFS transporter, YNFM family, putative membrane transport protein
VTSAERPSTTPEARSQAAPVALIVMTGLLVLIQLYVGIPLAPAVNAALTGGRASAALTTGFALGYASGFIVFGALSDHLGRRPLLVYGLAGLAVTTAAAGGSGTTGELACLRALQGLAAASFPAVAIAYLGENLAGRARTAAIGALSTAFLVAAVAGQLYASALADPVRWRWAFWIEAPLFATAAAAFALTLRNSGASPGPPLRLGRRFASLGTLLRRPDLARLYAAGFALLFVFVAFYQTLGRLLETHYDLGPSALQHVRLAGVPSMLVGPLLLSLCRGRDAAATAATGLRLAAIALIGLASATGRPPWTPILISAMFVLGVGIAVPALIAAVNQRAPDAPGAAASLYSASAFTGASLAPVLATPAVASSAMALLLALGLAAASAAASWTRATPSGCAC